MSKESKLKVTKEIADKVLFLNCEKEDDIRRLKKSLMKLPFMKSEKDLQTDNLEKLVKKIEIRNMIHLSYVMRSIVAGEDTYTGMIKTDTDKEKGKWLKTVYSITMWEMFAKTLFYMYYYVEGQKAIIKKNS